MSRHRILAIITALPLALTACGEQQPSDPRTQVPLVRTVTVHDAEVESRSFTGVVAARVESDLGFRVSGKVQQRLVDTGQTVKQGQLLMRIDPVDLKLAAHAQQAFVAAARARAKQTAENEIRYRNLRGTGAISVATYDQAKAAMETAQAELRAAEAQAAVARNSTGYTDLIADVDGTVIATLVEPGQVVNAGQAVVRIAHAGAREAVIQLPETLRPPLGSRGQATLFGRRDGTSAATLRQLSDAADPSTRTFEARYVLTGSLQNAPLGSTVTLHLTEDPVAATAGVQIPVSALFDTGKGPGVWRVHGQPTRVSWSPITVLNLGSDAARVAGHIKQGDLVVAMGAHLLHEGELVRTLAPSANVTTEDARP
ncbi:efflux RND transporter periplasmic adaptor subunit [Aeromonas allosaccharophila]|uniref:efflux RND transporter periplasmic adaptor subunit n=1 Tax=Aeromonas allosaccharophila TaxID=656 RepID=UPI003D1DB72B